MIKHANYVEIVDSYLRSYQDTSQIENSSGSSDLKDKIEIKIIYLNICINMSRIRFSIDRSLYDVISFFVSQKFHVTSR